MLIQVVGAFFGIISVSIIYGIDRKFFKYCGLAGAIGWLIYLVMDYVTGSEELRIYFATLAVALMAHIFARVLKAPVTMFLIPGILPLVPGLGMYRSVYNLIMVSNTMAGHYLLDTLQAAGCIALAIFTMDTIFRMINHRWYLIRWTQEEIERKKAKKQKEQ